MTTGVHLRSDTNTTTNITTRNSNNNTNIDMIMSSSNTNSNENLNSPSAPSPSSQHQATAGAMNNNSSNSASHSPPSNIPGALSSSNSANGPTSDDSLRHPLENVWVLWFLQGGGQSANGKWEDNLKIVHKFSTVEDFWSLFNHIKPASQLAKGCDYCLFKEGIIPKWEDEHNRTGGRWVMPIPKNLKEEVDKYWLETLLCLIGEAFEDEAGLLVNGCVVSVRPRGDRVSIWVGHKTEELLVTQIGRKIKERLKLKQSTVLNFQAHDDAITRNNSVTKNMYQV
ncbi:eukaryotic translation initiation factor 4E-like [Symsagittifera roscoffensis]|uniref:eukaryotic translation initiation factor 4E-like n=1 Tax=Symsagittifera roscoffensis TaxID=84072 RepID=UPI00307C0820